MPDILYLKAIAPFPPRAYSADVSRGSKNTMTSVKAAFVIERLNDVFGIFGWEFEENFSEKESGILCYGTLIIFDGRDKTRRIQSVGFHEKATKRAKWEDGKKVPGKFDMVPKLMGDVYKSASTDALGKAASKIGIANDVFKGLLPMNGYEIDRDALKCAYRGYFELLMESFGENIDEKTQGWLNSSPLDQLIIGVKKKSRKLFGGPKTLDTLGGAAVPSAAPSRPKNKTVAETKFTLEGE